MSHHVLLIDDDYNNLEVLHQALEIEGLVISVIQDSSQVPTMISQLPPIDLIFLDLEMPNINGYEVFEYLKSQPQYQNIPIVAHSVYVNEMANTREMGFAGFIGKPLDIDQFAQYLREIFAGNSVWV